MKIGEVARRTGLKVETVRFYEAEGWLRPQSVAAETIACMIGLISNVSTSSSVREI